MSQNNMETSRPDRWEHLLLMIAAFFSLLSLSGCIRQSTYNEHSSKLLGTYELDYHAGTQTLRIKSIDVTPPKANQTISGTAGLFQSGSTLFNGNLVTAPLYIVNNDTSPWTGVEMQAYGIISGNPTAAFSDLGTGWYADHPPSGAWGWIFTSRSAGSPFTIPSGGQSANKIIGFNASSNFVAWVYIYADAPVITGIAIGTDGSTITVSGYNFSTTQRYILCNGTAIPVLSWSDRSIIATMPSGTVTADIVVDTVDPNTPYSNTFVISNRLSLPPAVALFLDSSGSMTSLPCAMFDGDDACGVTAINPTSTFFVNTLGYAPNTDYGYSGTNPVCFDSNISPGGEGCFYGGTQSGTTTEGPLGNNMTPSGAHVYANGYFATTLPGYCATVTTTGTGSISGILPSYWYDCGTIQYFCYHRYAGIASRNQCISQLQSLGYWFGGTDSYGAYSFYSGNFLNFYPPKFVLLKKGIRETIEYNSDLYATGHGVRLGIFSFSSDSTGAETDVNIYPPCSQFTTVPSISMYLAALYKLTFDHATPLAGAIVQVAGYFANISTNSAWWDNLACNNNTYCSGLAGSNPEGACSPLDSWCGCYSVNLSNEQNDIIVITDSNENSGPSGIPGWPIATYDLNTSGESTACPLAPGGSCNIDEVTGFIYNNSVRPPSQTAYSVNINSYMISLAGLSNTSTTLDTIALQRAAANGGGLFINSSNWQALETACETVLTAINHH